MTALIYNELDNYCEGIVTMFKLEPYICHRLLEMFSYSDARRQGICNHIDMLIDAGRFTQSEVEQLTPVISHLKKVCVSEDGTFINNPDKGLLEILKVQDPDGYWYIDIFIATLY